MTRMVSFTLAVAVAIGLHASAQTNGGTASRVQSMAGVVKAVSVSALIVERSGNRMLFVVDSSTRLMGKNKGIRDLVYREWALPHFVKAGDQVTVRYGQVGNVMTAVEVRLTSRPIAAY